MGLTHSPSIVIDGLVYCVDPANVRSYPGTGTTLTDLKGSNNGTLTNGPTFSSDNRGVFTLDGTDDYIAVADSSENFTFANGNFSVGGWAATNSDNVTAYVLNKGVNADGGGWILTLTNSLVQWFRYYFDGSSVNQNVSYSHSLTGWTYILATCDTSGAAGDMKIYVNGSLATTGSFSEIKTSVSNTNALESGRLNIYGGLSIVYGGGERGTAHIYNKVLTADEVMQNYEATVGRYT